MIHQINLIFSIADVEKCSLTNEPAADAIELVTSTESPKTNQFKCGLVNDVIHHTLMFFYFNVNFVLLVLAILENTSIKNVVAKGKSEKRKSHRESSSQRESHRRDAKASSKELSASNPCPNTGSLRSPGPNRCPDPYGTDLGIHSSPYTDPVQILEGKQIPIVDDNKFVNYHSPVCDCDAIDYDATMKTATTTTAKSEKTARSNRSYKL